LAEDKWQGHGGYYAHNKSPAQPDRELRKARFLPTSNGPTPIKTLLGPSGHKDRVEVRRANGKFSHSQSVDHQGIKRAEKHRSSGHGQQYVVGKQKRLA